MRIPKSWLPFIARDIAKRLVDDKLVDLLCGRETFVNEIEAHILAELMVESKIDEEVRQILRSFEGEIEKNRLDYKKLFEMTKQKIVKERNIVL